MLCTELARFINPDVKNIEQIPAMAGMADRIDLKNPNAVQEYTKIAEKIGYSKNMLHEIASILDFVSKKLRFMEAREYIEVVFGEPREKQKKLASVMGPYIENLKKKGLEMALASSQKEKIGKTTFQYLEVEESLPGFGFYPRTGIVVELLHENFL